MKNVKTAVWNEQPKVTHCVWGAKLTVLLLSVLLLLSSLSSCNGTGGVADSEGETYGASSSSSSAGGKSSSGTSSVGGMTNSNGDELSALDIMNMMSGGHASEVEAILSGGNNEEVEEERGTFEVVLSATSMGLPEDGWVELELAGDAYFKGEAFAGPDGTIRFTVPRQRIGAIVTVSLTAYLPDGTPYTSGIMTGEANEGGTTSFSVPLVDLPRVTIDITGTKSSYGRTVEQDGVTYDVIEYTGSGLGMSVTNSDSEATMDIKLNDSTASASQSLPDGFNKIEVTAVKSEALPPVTAKKNVYVVKKLPEPTISFNGDHYPGQDTASYEMWKYSFGSHDNLKLSVTNTYDGNNPETGNATMEVTVTGVTSYTFSSETESVVDKVLNDGQQTITVTLTKPLCEPIEITKTIYAHIKKVRVQLTKAGVYIGDNTKLSGKANLGGRWIRDFGGVSWKKNATDYYNFKTDYDPNYYMTEKTDTLRYYTTGLKAGSDDLSDTDKTFSLSDIKSEKASRGYVYSYAYGSGGSTQHELYFDIYDDE